MPNTLFTAKVLERFDELPSTNDYLRDLVEQRRLPEGYVVRADNQSAGKGQLGSRWVVSPGANLTLSVLWYPTWLAAVEQFDLSIAVALAVRDAAEQAIANCAPIQVKWPNDLYINGQKAAGILIENALQGQYLQHSIIGIGLNVNQQYFPPDFKATSLSIVTGKTMDLEAVADLLFECLEQRYLQLRAGGHVLRQTYLQHLWQFGTIATYRRTKDNSIFEGVITGISPEGRLVVTTETGVEVFDLKAIAYK
jgi:BirA family transcriptional regulator, biotin operon repressor / biotin---[acetyl-CoA-carboxylase] ligase